MKEIKSLTLEVVKEKTLFYDEKAVTSPDIARDIFLLFGLNKKAEENLVMLALDTKNKVIGYFPISVGTLNSSMVHPREIFKRALLVNANTIMLAHNHPSGDVKPSNEDIAVTQMIAKAGILLGIELLDHIILGDNNNYTSIKNCRADIFRKEG